MQHLRRRWQSIGFKLPLLASGLVVVTVVVLGWTAYALLERALVDVTGRRLSVMASVVSQMVTRPLRAGDSTTRAASRAYRAFLRSTPAQRSPALTDSIRTLLARAQSPTDTLRFYAALVDTTGRPVVVYHREPLREPRWGYADVIRRGLPHDTVIFSPLSSANGVAVYSVLSAIGDTTRAGRPIAYVVESRAISGRGAKTLRDIIGAGVELAIGQPNAGVWTNLERVVPAPPEVSGTDSIVTYDAGVGAFAHIPGTGWMLWLSQPTPLVLAPARNLLWSMIPLGIAIALVGAALMWRIAYRITNPIVQLTDAVEGVAKDTRSLPTTAELPAHVAGADEITRLRFAVERMADRIAEREALEQQLRHAQKMEAIGKLAGGIAHDFNNLLTAIRSYADLMLDDMPQWDTKRGDVEEIRKAAQRASELTSQLLAFSRKQLLKPRVLDIAVVLNDVQTMLRRLLIEDIELVVQTPPGLWSVKADRGQLEQVIVNLAVNARDAMPHGGALRITASNETVAAPIPTKHEVVLPGEYVVIRVTDTGLGMDALTLSRVFEPFFTTKAVGKGTGLGLATVHGIIAQSGGYITVESQLSAGTTFTVYLPRVFETPSRRDSGGAAMTRRGNNETILLVEDEQAVRSLARRVLVRAGFRVLEATTPTDAMRLAREHFREIRLLLSDVVMPEMSGPALVAKILEVCPTAHVLFISGYTDDDVVGRGLQNPAMELLQKPFSAQQLVERVRAALDSEQDTTVAT
jgi:signal transduction histidine kinase/ActR/RegA family two-component response regulator